MKFKSVFFTKCWLSILLVISIVRLNAASCPGFVVTVKQISNVTCNAACNGEIQLAVLGGTAPYTYSWSSLGINDSIQNGLCVGLYAVTVSDALGCDTIINSIAISEPLSLVASVDTIINADCFNGLGTIVATATGGTSPYNYTWVNSGINNDTLKALSGTYTLQVTDANSCVSSLDTTILQPTVLIAEIDSVIDALCFNDNGKIIASALGGTSPYQYTWLNTANMNDTLIAVAGNYSLLVTDAQGCSLQLDTVIKQPANLTATVSTTPSYCGQPNGTATLQPSGGTQPYRFSWISGSTADKQIGLSAGNFTGFVFDKNNCAISKSVTITNVSGPTINNNVIQPSCFGMCKGRVNTLAVGGVQPYTYSWSNGNSGQTALNLCDGDYTLTVTDSANCVTVKTFTITSPLLLQTTISANPIKCNGVCDGEATANSTGGTMPYTYTWLGGVDNPTAKTVGALCANSYSVYTTDAKGCSAFASIQLSEPLAIQYAIDIVKPACDFYNGTATINVSGGNVPYTYSWSNGNTLATDTGMTVGRYYITVTDSLGCAINDSIMMECVTSIFANANELFYNLYPNPIDNHFTLELNVLSAETTNISILNMLGAEVQFIDKLNKTSKYSKVVDVQQLPPGIYMLAIKYDNNITRHKIVKR